MPGLLGGIEEFQINRTLDPHFLSPEPGQFEEGGIEVDHLPGIKVGQDKGVGHRLEDRPESLFGTGEADLDQVAAEFCNSSVPAVFPFKEFVALP